MATKFQIDGLATGLTVYVVLKDEAGLAWNGSSFAAYTTTRGDFDIPLAETAGTGQYMAAWVGGTGYRAAKYYIQAGGSPSHANDIEVMEEDGYFDGTNLVAQDKAGYGLADGAITFDKIANGAFHDQVGASNWIQAGHIDPGVASELNTGMATSSQVSNIGLDAAAAAVSAAEAVAAVNGLNNLSQANVRAAIGMATANLDTQLSGISSAGSPQLLQSTTIATLASQTSFTLTAGSADNDAYNDCLAIFTDQSTSTQRAVVPIQDYVGSTKTVTLAKAPAFTIATGDSISIVAVDPGRRTSPLDIDTEDTWTFNNSSQVTSPKLITVPVGTNPFYISMDFTRPITGGASIDTITSVTITDIVGATEPLIIGSAKSQDNMEVHITGNAALATANTYEVVVTIQTTTALPVIRKGRLVLQ